MTNLAFDAVCGACQGKRWVLRGDWPTECPLCTPTKVVKGKVVLAPKPTPRPAVIPVFTPSKLRYQGNGTTHYDWD